MSNYDGRLERFVLEYPNDEVKYDFMNSLAAEYLHLKRQSANNDIFSIDDSAENAITQIGEQGYAKPYEAPFLIFK